MIKKIIVIPTEDKKTREAIENFDCKILPQEGKGFGNALIQGINNVETKYFCIFNAWRRGIWWRWMRDVAVIYLALNYRWW